MPRGPGKKENYNFDYSRFAGAGVEDNSAQDEAIPAEMMKQLPGELQEAFRLMQIAKQTGDMKAQTRANELALKAVERGGPEMKQRFEKEVMKQAAQHPEAKKGLEAVLNESFAVATPARAAPVAAAGPPNSEKLLSSAEQVADLSGTISALHERMAAGAEEAKKQMEGLQRQQEALEELSGPEDFARFMAGQGLTEEDVQRALAGDEEHMKRCIDKAIGKADDSVAKKAEKLDKMIESVDELHRNIVGDTPDSAAPALAIAAPPAAAREPESPAAPAPSIPEHRVQYQKDADGRLQQVELRCELPGITGMGQIELDVSEKYLRLRTTSPAYVVNAGPFTTLVDAPAARAKFSKKRQELTLTVPAKH